MKITTLRGKRWKSEINESTSSAVAWSAVPLISHIPNRPFPFWTNFWLQNSLLDISKIEKSIINLVELWSLDTKYHKLCEIQSFKKVCQFCILLYYVCQSDDNHIRILIISLLCVMQTLNDCIFHILRYFANKLHSATKSMMLFPAVAMNSHNSKVESSSKMGKVYCACTNTTYSDIIKMHNNIFLCVCIKVIN